MNRGDLGTRHRHTGGWKVRGNPSRTPAGPEDAQAGQPDGRIGRRSRSTRQRGDSKPGKRGDAEGDRRRGNPKDGIAGKPETLEQGQPWTASDAATKQERGNLNLRRAARKFAARGNPGKASRHSQRTDAAGKLAARLPEEPIGRAGGAT